MTRQAMQTAPITLFGGGPSIGLPEVSPYVTKTLVQLKMAGVAYQFEGARPDDGPKGQIPFIQDGETRVGDSTFIRGHIEAAYGIDLDDGLTPAERATAWAIERMVENQLGWTAAWFRFFDEESFEKGPAHWFDWAPEDQREAMKAGLLAQVELNLKAVGIARHSPEEIVLLATRSLWSLSTLLADKPFLMGQRPTSVDAIVFGILAQILTPYFDSPVRRCAESFPNLVAYVDRMMGRFFPDHPWTVAMAPPMAA